MRRFAVLAAVLALFAAGAVVASYSASDSLTAFISVKAPATFEYSCLTIVPSEVLVGKPAVVSLTIKNTGDYSGTYSTTPKVDGRELETISGFLSGGGSTRVSFNVSFDKAGTYLLTVGGLQESLTVKAPSVVRWPIVLGIIVACGLAAGLFLAGIGREAPEKLSFRERWMNFLSKLKSKFRKGAEDETK